MKALQIVDLKAENESQIQQVAGLLVAGFQEHWPDAWSDLEEARAEVQESFGKGRISRVAVDDKGRVLGWIGAIEQYDGHVWELHPLVVDPALHRQGIGRRLVIDLEEQVRRRGGLTLFLGSDDESSMTSLSDVDLYPQPLEHIARIENRRGHPYEFYQKLGFVIVGVLPDANGPGKPDIFMAKRVGARPIED